MKKKVTFIETKLPKINYDENILNKTLRDKIIPNLVNLYKRKLDAGLLEDAEYNHYLITTFNYALKAELDPKAFTELKLEFLPYNASLFDKIIHNLSFQLIGLCKGSKRTIENFIRKSALTDENGNIIEYTEIKDDKESLKALSINISQLAKRLISEYLEELNTTGKIKTTAELTNDTNVGQAQESDNLLSITETEESNVTSSNISHKANHKKNQMNDAEVELYEPNNYSQQQNYKESVFLPPSKAYELDLHMLQKFPYEDEERELEKQAYKEIINEITKRLEEKLVPSVALFEQENSTNQKDDALKVPELLLAPMLPLNSKVDNKIHVSILEDSYLPNAILIKMDLNLVWDFYAN